jgi:hypothetical protein
MPRDETKRAAQEFLAAQFTEAVQIEEDRLNSQAAIALAPEVWKRVAETFIAQCEAWNAITKEESLSCKETILGDLRVRCAGKPDIITVHYDSKKLQVILKNTAASSTKATPPSLSRATTPAPKPISPATTSAPT